MKNDSKGMFYLMSCLMVACLILSVVSLFAVNGVKSDSVSKDDLSKAIDSIVIPEVNASEIAALVKVPEVEEDIRLDKFLERKFSSEYDEIKDAAEYFALEELEDDDFEVILDCMLFLFSEMDEDSMSVDIEDVDVEVLELGLDEDEDKVALVTFELEVEYELEEGVRDEFEKDLVVVYKVVFDEGDLSDEKVSLVSIQ